MGSSLHASAQIAKGIVEAEEPATDRVRATTSASIAERAESRRRAAARVDAVHFVGYAADVV